MPLRALGVQSRHLVDRVEDESIWLRCPDFADVFVRREAAERLEPLGEVVGCQEVREMRLQLIVGFVAEAFYSRVLDCSFIRST
jgi:hypothetical protein